MNPVSSTFDIIFAAMIFSVLLSVLILGDTTLYSGHRVSSAQAQLSDSAYLESLNTELVMVLNTLISRQLSLISAKTRSDLESVAPGQPVYNRLTRALTELKQTSSVESLDNSIETLVPLIEELITKDRQFETKTNELLLLIQQAQSLTNLVEENATEIVSQSARMVKGLSKAVENESEALKSAMNDSSVFSDSQKLAGLREILQRLLLGNRSDQQKASFKIRTNIIKLAGIAKTMAQINNLKALA